MTNYNERLDEIFAPLIDSPSLTLTTTYWDETKQALTALIKELVAEAKPLNKQGEIDIDEPAYNDSYYSGAYSTLEKFEQNLLKALEEV